MKKQEGMSAIKLILIIALGILLASFIGCVGSIILTGAALKEVNETIKQPLKTPIATKTPQQIEYEAQLKRAIEYQQEMARFKAEQQEIQRNRPMVEPTKNYIEKDGKRIAIKTTH
jgi:flagellar capping protein FliD